jgi:G3E family GTPase
VHRVAELAQAAVGPVPHHAHGQGIATFAFSFATPLPWPRVQRWLAALRAYHGESLLRVKGILDLEGEAAPVVVHGVHHVFHPPVHLAAWPDGQRGSRLVLITDGLDRATAEALWAESAAEG